MVVVSHLFLFSASRIFLVSPVADPCYNSAVSASQTCVRVPCQQDNSTAFRYTEVKPEKGKRDCKHEI